MARFEITAPDGLRYEITAPDDASEQDVLKYARDQFSQQQEGFRPPSGGPISALASGVNKGVLSYLPGMPADFLLNLAELAKAGLGVGYSKATGRGVPSALEAVGDRSQIPLTSDWFAKLISSSQLGREAIESGSEQYPTLHAGGAAIGTSLVGARNAPLRTTGSAFTAGAGAHEVGQRTGSQEAAIISGLAIPTVAGLAASAARTLPSAIMSPAQRQAEVALRPYTQQEINRGIALQKSGQAARLPISPSQALGGGGRVSDLESYVYESPATPKSMLQEAQLQPTRAKTVSGLAARFFGRPDQSISRANQIEAAADQAMEWPRQMASRSVQHLYDQLNRTRPQLPEHVRWNLANQLDDLTKKVGLLEQSSAGQAVSEVARKATIESQIVNKSGVPFRRAEGGIYELDNYLKELRTRIEALSKVNPDAKQLVERAGLTPAAANIRQALIDNSKLLEQAKDQYRTIKTTLDETVRSTAIPEMSRRFNQPDVSTKTGASWTTLEKLFTRQQSPDDLGRAATILGRFDPQAVSDVFKNILREKYNKAFGKSDIVSLGAPADFARDVRSIPNLDKAVELTAKASGIRQPELAAQGFKDLLSVIEASGLPRGRGAGTPSQVEKQSPGRSFASLLFGHGIARAATIVRNVQYALNKSEIDLLIKTLDNPNSLEKLVELSKTPPTSVVFKKIVSDLTNPDKAIATGGLYGTISATNDFR